MHNYYILLLLYRLLKANLILLMALKNDNFSISDSLNATLVTINKFLLVFLFFTYICLPLIAFFMFFICWLSSFPLLQVHFSRVCSWTPTILPPRFLSPFVCFFYLSFKYGKIMAEIVGLEVEGKFVDDDEVGKISTEREDICSCGGMTVWLW